MLIILAAGQTVNSTSMTTYEKIAITISIIAILIPIIQWAWNKWMKKAKMKYIHNGTIELFFNQSGPYIRLDGVCEAINKPITIKKISVSINRKRDDKKLNLSWSYLISPVNQNLVGNFIQATEKAHPFRIDANSICCAFIEFIDPFDAVGKSFQSTTKELFSLFHEAPVLYKSYDEAIAYYRKTSEYTQAKNTFEKEFFWEMGEYDIVVYCEYDNKKIPFYFTMMVDEESHNRLHNNVDESLITPLKGEYNIAPFFQKADIFIEKKPK